MKPLSNKQKAAAELMVAEPELHYTEVAEQLEINPLTLYRWRQREDFKEYMHNLCMERFKELEKIAVQKLYENVMNNNQKAIEYTLDYIGYKATNKIEADVTGNTSINITIED